MFPSYFQDILCPANKAMAEDEKTPSATSAGAGTPVLTLRGGQWGTLHQSNMAGKFPN